MSSAPAARIWSKKKAMNQFTAVGVETSSH